MVWNKKESIERCLRQIRTYYALESTLPFAEDHLKQDAIAINLQCACEQAIDLANYIIRKKKLGLPKESRESFLLLTDHNILPRDLAIKLGKMVGFRNTLIHEDQELDLGLMVEVIEHHLDDLIEFTNFILRAVASEPSA